jgi:hypothetical protein
MAVSLITEITLPLLRLQQGQRCRKSLAHMITVIASATPPGIRVESLALEKV